jgi:hypothetical protein
MAHLDGHPHPTCGSRKLAWATKSDARRALRQVQSKPGTSVQRVYRCPDCDTWHLTSSREPTRTPKPFSQNGMPAYLEAPAWREVPAYEA